MLDYFESIKQGVKVKHIISTVTISATVRGKVARTNRGLTEFLLNTGQGDRGSNAEALRLRGRRFLGIREISSLLESSIGARSRY